MPQHTVKWPPLTFGDRVIYWREKRDLDQSALARKAGVKLTTLSTIERGLQKSSSITPKLAIALQVNVHYLASGEGDPLDIKATPAPRNHTEYLTELVSPDLVAGLTTNELELAQIKIRDLLTDIIKKRPAVRLRKTA